MEFGLFCLNAQRDISKRPREIFLETLDQVRAVEDVGFDVAWFAEHHFSNYCLCPSPMTMTTYMAGQTKRIKLGPAVIVAPLYEKIRLLEDIGVADQLSDGRLVLGFGTGYQAYEFHKFGVDLKTARDQLIETLDLVELYFSGEPVSFDGKYVKLPPTSFSVTPLQKKPAVYIAGMASDVEMQRRAVERNYVPFFTTGWNSHDTNRQTRVKVEAAYSAAGGDTSTMPFALQRYAFVTTSKKQAQKAADGARYIRRIASAMRENRGVLDGAFLKELPAPDEPSLDEIESRLLIGDAERVAEKLATESASLGVSHVSCFMAIPGLEQSEVLRSIEEFGRSVIPAVNKHEAWKTSKPISPEPAGHISGAPKVG
ncbi:MAG: LLM class flavin-dependent oxidoreductase [Pseudolabrys sp.]|nr:LLM class flavin-dependent oxidoreductase [Pseudolabrys sp.]